MKKNLTVLVVAVVVIFIAALVKDIVIKISIEKGAELVTGLKLRIGGLNVGVLRPIVSIKNFRLLNPANFSDKTMINMPEIYVKYDLPAIIGGKIHLPEVRLSLKEFVVVKNAKGELNLNALRIVQAQKEGKAPSQGAPGRAPDIKIDFLKLKIGKVIYKDYSRPGAPSVREYNINLDESYTNVDNPYELASLIVVRAMSNTSISSLTNFDLGGLQGTVGNTLATTQRTVKQVAETAKNAQDTVNQVAGALKDVFNNPFGSGK